MALSTRSTSLSSTAKVEKEIAAYEATDRTSPSLQGAVLFVGDSGMRKWNTLAEGFPAQQVINCGFGASQRPDGVSFADRIVIPYKARVIVLREGDRVVDGGEEFVKPVESTGVFRESADGWLAVADLPHRRQIQSPRLSSEG